MATNSSKDAKTISTRKKKQENYSLPLKTIGSKWRSKLKLSSGSQMDSTKSSEIPRHISCHMMNQMLIEAVLVELVITKECRSYSSAGTTSGGLG
jgi:hypothetical protein